MGFPGSSAGKESVCNAGDPSLIPALGRSPVEGIGFLLQYSWASLVAQMVTNLIIMWETWSSPWVGKIHWKSNRYPLQYSYLKNSMDKGTWRATVYGVAKSQTQLSNAGDERDAG